MDEPRDPSQTAAAIRSRRRREREKAGLKLYPLLLPEAWTDDMLVAAGFLDPLAADDHEKAVEALCRMVLAVRTVTRDEAPEIFPPL